MDEDQTYEEVVHERTEELLSRDDEWDHLIGDALADHANYDHYCHLEERYEDSHLGILRQLCSRLYELQGCLTNAKNDDSKYDFSLKMAEVHRLIGELVGDSVVEYFKTYAESDVDRIANHDRDMAEAAADAAYEQRKERQLFGEDA